MLTTVSFEKRWLDVKNVFQMVDGIVFRQNRFFNMNVFTSRRKVMEISHLSAITSCFNALKQNEMKNSGRRGESHVSIFN